MTVLGDMQPQVAAAEAEAAAGVEARIAEVRNHLIKTHFRARSGALVSAPRDVLNLPSLTTEEAQTLADILAGGDVPEGANDTIVVCAEHCAAVGVDSVDGFPPTPRPKKTKKKVSKT